ncbi:MAG: sulfotransferase, partial [Pseudomonadota bacterium]
HSRLQMSLGHALKTVGRQADSVAAYRRAIAAEPGLGEAYWSLANLKTFRFADNDLRTMQNLVETGEIEQRDEFHLCFALGKGLEDAGQYAESFHFYERGNLLKQQQSRYDPDENAQTFDHIIAHTSAAHFTERADYGHAASDPIFIVGLPRSGSTLLEQILASHPLVDGTMELPNVLQFVRRLSGKRNRDDPSSYPQALWSMSAAECHALGQEYLDATRVQRGEAPFFIDKMPNNFAHVGLIHMILPNAKIIDARRHPLATCFSCFKQLFAAGQEFTYGLDVIGGYYRDYLRIMAHWDAVLPGRVLRVQYEDVIEDLEHQVRRMLDYCGLEFDARCLAFHENKRAVRTASSEQVRQPLYTDAVHQWQHFQAHLQPLHEILGDETVGLNSP